MDNKEFSKPEKRIPVGEQAVRFDWEKEKNLRGNHEKKEISSDEKMVSEQLRKEIEIMELDENLKAEASKKAQKIEFLGEKEKIEHLLKITRERGVVFAVQVAKKMNDSYLLDVFHDILAKEGYYKKISK
jgi:hypothetical protein